MSFALYLISPPTLPENFTEALAECLKSKAFPYFQLRLKNTPANLIKKAAFDCRDVCRAFNVAFIVNDDPELAHECDADGVHVGESDARAAYARQRLGSDKIVGVSCYDSLEFAAQAEKAGASYVSFGAFFPTTTKIPKTNPPLSILSDWKKQSRLPCCAIGGINAQNIPAVRQAGADMAAFSGAIWNDN